MTIDELKKGWAKVTILRDLKDRTEEVSQTELSETEFDVLCFIAHQNGTATITAMTTHPYFKGVSLSTIKRAVLLLTKETLIQATEGDDRRERYLSVVGG
jgi:DNA-binding MarR family transcriptional regulator|tara:strand:- start:222 stop:521 length:300 start_codon:yes stop_codon:yes gene_type:complete